MSERATVRLIGWVVGSVLATSFILSALSPLTRADRNWVACEYRPRGKSGTGPRMGRGPSGFEGTEQQASVIALFMKLKRSLATRTSTQGSLAQTEPLDHVILFGVTWNGDTLPVNVASSGKLTLIIVQSAKSYCPRATGRLKADMSMMICPNRPEEITALRVLPSVHLPFRSILGSRYFWLKFCARLFDVQ